MLVLAWRRCDFLLKNNLWNNKSYHKTKITNLLALGNSPSNLSAEILKLAL